MTKTPRWMTAVLRESAGDLPVMPWQRGYRSDRVPAASSPGPASDDRLPICRSA